MMKCTTLAAVLSACAVMGSFHLSDGLSLGNQNNNQQKHSLHQTSSRRNALGWIAGTTASVLLPRRSVAEVDVEDYARSGFALQPMGISGQAGKSRPETGVILRDGSDISRDSRSGDVLAEILLKGKGGTSSDDDMVPILASFSSPWPLATGSVFDVECRDAASGDGVFLAVSSDTKGKRSASELSDSFIVNSLVAPTGRFSFYGTPTDVKVRNSETKGDNCKIIDLTFSTLSQSTQTEIPRRARIGVTIPEGTSQAVMLVASTSLLRYKKSGSDQTIQKVIDSFRAFPAPETKLKVRAKPKRNSIEDA